MIVLRNKEFFLLGKRALWKEKAPRFWCPISGHVEDSETEEEAVEREAREELGVHVKAVRKVATTLTRDKTVSLHWWIATVTAGKPVLNNNENTEIRWFSKVELRELEPVFKEDIEILLNL